MTDKTDTPEQIALNWSEGAAVTSGPLFDAQTRWVREDVAHAMVAAALGEAAKAARDYGQQQHDANLKCHPGYAAEAKDDGIEIAYQITALTPDDARAALERMIAEAAADVWSAVETLAAAGTPPDGMLSIAKSNAAAIRARKNPPAD